ncbi:MAG: hypothetical protein AB7L84_09065, partial [Acidimicrobiia bacterium]
PLGAGCDSGAVERSPEPPPPPPPPATLEVSVSAACSADERVACVEVSTSGAGVLTLDVRVVGVLAGDDHVVADGVPASVPVPVAPTGTVTVEVRNAATDAVLHVAEVSEPTCGEDPAVQGGDLPRPGIAAVPRPLPRAPRYAG